MFANKSPGVGVAEAVKMAENTVIEHPVSAPNRHETQEKLDLVTKAESIHHARAQLDLGKKWCAMRLGNFSLSPESRWPLMEASATIESVRWAELPLPVLQAAVAVIQHSLRISHHVEALENAQNRFANADRGWQ